MPPNFLCQYGAEERLPSGKHRTTITGPRLRTTHRGLLAIANIASAEGVGSIHARCIAEMRRRGFAPHGHWRTLTFLGALRCDRLTAPSGTGELDSIRMFVLGVVPDR